MELKRKIIFHLILANIYINNKNYNPIVIRKKCNKEDFNILEINISSRDKKIIFNIYKE